jgi:DegV family protein with EDD domain
MWSLWYNNLSRVNMPKAERNIAIVYDSAASLPIELKSEPYLKEVSFTINIPGQRQWPDHPLGPNSTQEKIDFLNDLMTAKLSTSQPNPEAYRTAFSGIIEEGVTEIIVVPISIGLSHSMDSAQYAANELSDRANIVVVDSKTASIGQSLLIAEALRTRGSSVNATDLAERVERLSKKLHVAQIFSDLSHLKRGGRIGRANWLAGSLLSVKPILSINTEGTIEPIGRERGWGRACEAVVNYIAKCVGENAVRLAFAHFETDKLENLHNAALNRFILAKDKSGRELDTLECEQSMVLDVYSGTDVVGLGALIIDSDI